jgi:electron transfer flavoprotein beta subunit
MLDDGVETLDAPLPIVITVTKEINQPRLATIRGRLNARKTEIRHITSKDIQALPSQFRLDGSYTRVVKIFTLPPQLLGRL